MRIKVADWNNEKSQPVRFNQLGLSNINEKY